MSIDGRLNIQYLILTVYKIVFKSLEKTPIFFQRDCRTYIIRLAFKMKCVACRWSLSFNVYTRYMRIWKLT